MSYTAKDLESILEEYHAEEPYEYKRGDGTIVSGFHTHESWDGLAEQLDGDESVALVGIGILRLIENIGGEGQGDYAALVFEVTDAQTGVKRLFRKEGFYTSYDSETFWEGAFAEVEAYEKTVTDYREIKSNG